MCGICGWASTYNLIEHGRIKLEKMVEILNHRGPDDSGVWLDSNIALGHSRLSIIDLKEGHQPMSGSNGNIIVFNGEIYNYKEIKEELLKYGFNFKTHSDTEVILASYEKWGFDCLEKLIGMYSFTIWNPAEKKIFLARDPLGKKPLYYYNSPTLFVFASEIKALLVHDEIKRNIDISPYSISDYLSLGYILTPKTIFKSIHRLPAGHYAIYNLEEKRLSIKKYWNLENYFCYGSKIDYSEKSDEEFLGYLEDAVKIRMRSDTPIGAMLSGGLDSSSVASIMSRFSSIPVQTFCIGFTQDSFDESHYARIVAKHLNARINIQRYKTIADSELSKLVWHFDEPFSDNSFLAMYQLSRFASENVKVSLSGDGADEILGGYPTYIADKIYNVYSNITPLFFQKYLYYFFQNVLRPSYKKVSWDYKIIQFLKGYGNSQEAAHYWWRVIFNEEEKKQIMSPYILEQCKDYNPFETFKEYFSHVKGVDFLNRSLYVDIKTWLQDDILVKVDRMSMATSHEIRSPFLDKRIVQYAAGLPANAKMNGLKQKVILRNSMKNILPSQIIYRSKKGFNTPTYLYASPSIKYKEIISDKYKIDSKKSDVTFKTFNLNVLQKWLDIYYNFKKTGEWEAMQYE